MKKSKYCFDVNIDNNYIIIYQLLSFKIMILTGEDSVIWKKGEIDKINPLKQKEMLECGMLINEENDDKFILMKALKYFTRRRKDVPSHTIFITNECNMCCPYCFEKNIEASNLTMSEEMLESVFYAIKSSNGDKTLKKILIFGGEPLLRKNSHLVIHLLKLLRKLKYKYVEIVTNGIEIPFFIDMISEFQDVIGSMRLTLNGYKEVHNHIRDTNDINNSYDIIISSIKTILNVTNIDINLNVLIDSGNINSIQNMLVDLKENEILDNDRVHIGFGRTQFPTTPNEVNYSDEVFLEDYYSTLINLYSRNELVDIEMLQGGEIPILCELIHHILSNNKQALKPDLTSCRATYPGRYCYYPDGYIYPCTEVAGMKKFAVGSFFSAEEKYDNWKEWENYKFPQKCLKCKYIAFCSGGCPVSNLCSNGKIDEVYCYNVGKTIENTLIGLFREGYIDEATVY